MKQTTSLNPRASENYDMIISNSFICKIIYFVVVLFPVRGMNRHNKLQAIHWLQDAVRILKWSRRGASFTNLIFHILRRSNIRGKHFNCVKKNVPISHDPIFRLFILLVFWRRFSCFWQVNKVNVKCDECRGCGGFFRNNTSIM